MVRVVLGLVIGGAGCGKRVVRCCPVRSGQVRSNLVVRVRCGQERSGMVRPGAVWRIAVW